MLRRPEKITFAWVNDVVILMAKTPFTDRSKYPNPRIKIFPGDACRLSQWNVAASVLHLPLHTVVCMKDMPFDLISSDLLNFLDNKDNTTWKYSTILHISKMLFLIYCFFLIEFGSSLLIRWSFNTVYQLQERVILYSSYFHSEGRLFNLYCVQNLLPVIFFSVLFMFLSY